MRKSIKTTIFATVFFIGYAVGFLACGAAYAKGSSTLLRKAAYDVPVSLRGAGSSTLLRKAAYDVPVSLRGAGSSTLLRKAAYGVPVSLRGAGEEQPAAVTTESADVVHMDQVAGIKATEYGVYLTFYDGTGYWWEY